MCYKLLIHLKKKVIFVLEEIIYYLKCYFKVKNVTIISIIYILDILHLLFIKLIEKRERNCYFYIINMIKKVRSLLFFFNRNQIL